MRHIDTTTISSWKESELFVTFVSHVIYQQTCIFILYLFNSVVFNSDDINFAGHPRLPILKCQVFCRRLSGQLHRCPLLLHGAGWFHRQRFVGNIFCLNSKITRNQSHDNADFAFERFHIIYSVWPAKSTSLIAFVWNGPKSLVTLGYCQWAK